MLVDALSATFRALSFVAMFQAAGTAMFIVLFRRPSASAGFLRRLGVVSAVLAAALVLAHYALEAARMSGDLAGMADPSLQGLVLHSSMSAALALRLGGLVLLSIGFYRSTFLALAGAMLILIGFTAVGHTTTHLPQWALAALLLFHLAVVAFWFGALLPLYAIVRGESLASAAVVVERFSRLAVWLVPGLFAAGLGLAVLLLPNLAALGSEYGRLLLLKVFGFGALMVLAALNKWRFGPALARNDARAASAFARAVMSEYVLIVGILGVTAVLTTFYSPDGV